MDQLKKEIDYVMLNCIVRHGFEAMPQDYAFLTRHYLLSIYLELVKVSTARRPIKPLEEAAKSQASIQLESGCNIDSLREYYREHGRIATKALFGDNILYWQSFLKLLKR